MTTTYITKELQSLPNDLKQEVYDFISFLKHKKSVKTKSQKPKFGCLKGKIKMLPNFEEPLTEFNQ